MNKKATITDIQGYSPINSSKIYFLDTNVLYWYTNPRISSVNDLIKRAQPYYTFIDTLVDAGNPLKTSVYNLTELLNVIEKNEYDIYIELHPEDKDVIQKKDYRRMSTERKKLQNIMKTTLNNVQNICDIIDFPFELTKVADFVNTLRQHRYDVFDYMILDNYTKTQTINIISDDSDFLTYFNINLFTTKTSVLPDL